MGIDPGMREMNAAEENTQVISAQLPWEMWNLEMIWIALDLNIDEEQLYSRQVVKTLWMYIWMSFIPSE